MEYIKKFLSVTDISKILGIARATVIYWVTKGHIEYSRVGNLLKIRPKDLMKYLKDLGNSEIAMIDFEKKITKYLEREYGDVTRRRRNK